MTKRSIDAVPIGADKRFLVLCDGRPFAGFNSRSAAQAYIGSQKEKRNHNKGGPAMAAKADWRIQERKV